ncbi:Lrp/AsnC family transcriptional regulator [Neisseria iguanae]|uniref:Lrp/AsnC family transcriptional regulator n=1 Tax=Neisseria iguanae TaxID=90242 RepID=UPI001FE8592F|nr:Lrp/AsnC family transcriptional regulator [Neisseria iguanae]
MISRQMVLVSLQAVGFGISMFVQIELEHRQHNVQEASERAMNQEQHIMGRYGVSGDDDFLLLVHCADMPVYHASTCRILTAENNVRNFKSQFVMNFAKAENKD